VFGTDLDVAKQAALTEAGGLACPDIASVCEKAPVILTSLPSPYALAAVAAAIAATASPCVVVETSTMALSDKTGGAGHVGGRRAYRAGLHAERHGAQAVNRDLVVYASGDTAAIAAQMPLFSDFARAAHDIGRMAMARG